MFTHSLEANIVRHCNMRCIGCSHGSPFTGKYFISPETLRNDLQELLPVINFTEFMILGGEPLLHPDLLEIISVVKDSGITKQITLSTNGVLLHKQDNAFWETLRGLVLRITGYPGTIDRNNYELASSYQEQYGFDLQHWVMPGFFYQFKNVVAAESFAACNWKNQCLTIHEGRLYRCPQSAFFPGRYGIPAPEVQEGISVKGITETEVESFIKGEDPLYTCGFCESFTNVMPWSDDCKTEQEWVEKSTWKG